MAGWLGQSITKKASLVKFSQYAVLEPITSGARKDNRWTDIRVMSEKGSLILVGSDG